jgi:DNA-binding NarL/FixJ family response regulator
MPLLEAAALEAAGEAASAAALFRRCGALYDVRRIEEAQGAVASESIDETAAMLALLSPREREIATLAAGGRTNLEIAKTLSITHKTVEKHLSAAYRKVGVSSRAALRPYVLRGGADRRRAASASQRDAVERASASE